ncbi:MAG TPA: c-type cytochrome [Pseudolabrys sp.]|nr:c-type cytochrome [Pseudolabrys sp.]
MYPVSRLKRDVLIGVFLSATLIGCSDNQSSDNKSASGKPPAVDLAAGKAIAEKSCKPCHGLDGKGTAAGIPNLAGQIDRYLVASLQEYKDGTRLHGALRDIASQLSESETQNVAAYFANLPPIASGSAAVFSPFDHGKAQAPACTKCHGENGNSTTRGTPNLAGQQPQYFVNAVHEYLEGTREKSPMHVLIRGLDKVDVDSLALFFASQSPVARPPPPFGDAAAGGSKTFLCAGCHGLHGVSTDSATPSLASQDPVYLVNAIKAYRNTRRNEAMQRAVAGLSDTDVDNIAAYFTVQNSRAAEGGSALVHDITEKCDRCHGAATPGAALAFPRIQGQDKDYLVMALRAYRDGRRHSSVMHNMSVPYGDAIIESLASFYASKEAAPTK